MAQQKATFIKVPTEKSGFQTMPVEPSKRIADSDIKVQRCEEKDIDKIVEGLYTCFPESWWANMEPVAQRPPLESTRVARLAARLRPSFSNPHMNWIKAVLVPSGEIVGVAGWVGPGNPVHNIWRRSATDFYGWREQQGWSDDDIEEMWAGVGEKWQGQFERDDEVRRAIFDGEPHWYLAPLLTWPEYQGRGVGSRLLDWAIRQADATEPVTPMYLESAPSARPVYMHVGFVPQGEVNFVRRGPAVVRGLEAEEEGEKKVDNVNVSLVENQADAGVSS